MQNVQTCARFAFMELCEEGLAIAGDCQKDLIL